MRANLKIVKILGQATALIMSIALGACELSPSHRKDGEELVLGYVDTFSGPRAGFGNSVRNGILLALDEYNRAQSAATHQVRIIILDDEENGKKSAILTQKLIEEHKVIGLFGAAASSRSLQMAPVAQKFGVPMVLSASTHPAVTKIGDAIFRICFVDTFQGDVMAKYLFHNRGIKKVAILKDISVEYSILLADVFAKRFSELGGEVLAQESYEGGDLVYDNQLRAIKNLNPDLVYIPGFFVDVMQIVPQARQMGIKAAFAGGDGWDSSDFMKSDSRLLNDAIFTSHFSSENPDQNYKLFQQKYKRRYKQDPNAFSALGFDAANVMLNSLLSIPRPTRENLKLRIAQTKDHLGVTGNITLNAERNPIKPAVVLQITAGVPKFLEMIQPY